jgi:hypothetical protein
LEVVSIWCEFQRREQIGPVNSVGNMSRVVLLAIAYWGLSIGVSFQVPQSAPFTIHVTKIQRVNGGCAVDAESTSIRFKLRSSVPAACAMLKAGESYEAFRGITTTDPKDETKDSSSLVIANNVKNSRRPNAVFAIDSEESSPQKLETAAHTGGVYHVPRRSSCSAFTPRDSVAAEVI